MRSLSGILLILFMLFSVRSSAQSGCLVASNNNTVYTQVEDSGLVNAVLSLVFGGNPVYKPNPNEPSISNCVSNSQTKWVPTTQNCTVCPGGYSYSVLGLVTGCQTTTYTGKVASKTIVQCDLDDYSWLLATAAGACGFLFIRRQLT